MITAFLLGSLITLVSVVTGYLLGKPYLDKRLNKPTQKTVSAPSTKPTTI